MAGERPGRYAPAPFGGAMRPATPAEAEAFVARLAAEDAARREAAVARYGPEETALAPCERERALRDGALLLLVPGGDGRPPSLMGWTDGPASTLPPEVRREIATAVRMPGNVAAAWAEWRHWRERGEVLAAFRPEEAQPLWVRARIALIEERLDTLPAGDRDDVLARVSWMQEAMLSEYPRPIAQDEACLAQLRQDIETGAVPLPERAPETPGQERDPRDDITRSGEGSDTAPFAEPGPAAHALTSPEPAGATTVQVGHRHRTREEAREAVRALLGEDLTDREIARRVGVSPSTVAAVRRTQP